MGKKASTDSSTDRLNADQKWALKRLFPEGVNQTKVWTNFILPLSQADGSFEKVLNALQKRMKLQARIAERFPTLEDLDRLKKSAVIPVMRRIMTKVYGNEWRHSGATRSSMVLHGDNPRQLELDHATQAAVSILIKFTDSDLFK